MTHDNKILVDTIFKAFKIWDIGKFEQMKIRILTEIAIDNLRLKYDIKKFVKI